MEIHECEICRGIITNDANDGCNCMKKDFMYAVTYIVSPAYEEE